MKCCVCGKLGVIISACYTSSYDNKSDELPNYVSLPFCKSCAEKKLNCEIQANIDFCKKHIKKGYPK